MRVAAARLMVNREMTGNIYVICPFFSSLDCQNVEKFYEESTSKIKDLEGRHLYGFTSPMKKRDHSRSLIFLSFIVCDIDAQTRQVTRISL